MKLKKKFTTMVLDKDIADWEKECEQIADEFAIEFAEWLVSNCYCEDDKYWWYIKVGGDVKKSSEELLEIFKKEKGL